MLKLCHDSALGLLTLGCQEFQAQGPTWTMTHFCEITLCRILSKLGHNDYWVMGHQMGSEIWGQRLPVGCKGPFWAHVVQIC